MSSLIAANSWSILEAFQQHFPTLTTQILAVPLPLEPVDDVLIWEHSSNGMLTFTSCYNSFLGKSPAYQWNAALWSKYIPPKFSILAWKLFHERLSTEDNLRLRGMYIVSACQLCTTMQCEETISHLFFNCHFAKELWELLSFLFNTCPPPPGNVCDLRNFILSKQFPSHTSHMWLMSSLALLYHIWKARNKLKFENTRHSIARIKHQCLSYISHLSKLCPGFVSLPDSFPIYNLLSLSKPLPTSPKIHTILWHPPIFSWVKVNTDDLSKGNSGPISCGAIYRGPHRTFLGCFTMSIRNQPSFYTELYAIICAIEFAYHKGWHSLWLECDSMTTYSCLKSDIFSPPWQLRTRWLNCLIMIKSMRFHCSHIYREGNDVADTLANIDLSFSDFTWWDFPPSELKSLCLMILGEFLSTDFF